MANSVRVPKYYQLKGELLRLIEGAAVGTLLPTERDLAERFAVSRTTVRQAIAELVVEGRLERTQGSGTYVSEPKLIQLRQLSSFTEDIGDRRTDARSEVLDISRVAADGEVARALEVAEGTKVQRVERLRIVSDEPIAHEIAHLAGSYPPAGRRAGQARIAVSDLGGGVRRRPHRSRGRDRDGSGVTDRG